MLENTLYSFLQKHGFQRTYWLAYSGGLDSRVLLRLCVKLRQQSPFTLKAIHIHHGLSPRADQWLQACQSTCEQESVDFVHLSLETQPLPGESVEEYARKHRYEKLAAILGPEDMLLTAHHQDDQAETVLLQLLRGAGPKGLSAMPAVKPLGQGLQGRPLLGITRAELLTYAEQEKLHWIEDEMNLDPHFSRNYLRHEILPLLKKRWPTVTATIARVAENCAEAQGLLDSFTNQDLAAVKIAKAATLSVSALLKLPPERQRACLRLWFEQRKVVLPSAVKLQQMLDTVLQASWDSTPCVAWGEVELRRYQDELYLLPRLPPHDKDGKYAWNLVNPLAIPGVGRLAARAANGVGLSRAVKAVEVRFRQGGEVFRLAKGNHHELKKFFQERGIPPWRRDRLPLVYVGDELAAIPGYLVVEQFKAGPEEGGHELILVSNP